MDLNEVQSRRMQLAVENHKLMAKVKEILTSQHEIHSEDTKLADIEAILKSPISDESKMQILTVAGIKGAEKFGTLGIPERRSSTRMIKLVDFYKRMVGR